jgi:meiotic recombination protein SPO11
MYVIVVEKDAVFNRLIQERCFERFPVVIVTARGFPDVGTRKFLYLLERAMTEDSARRGVAPASFYALVDWNPSGLYILSTYSAGCAASSMDARDFVIPTLKWLGFTKDDLWRVPEGAMQRLTSTDEALITNALSREDVPEPIRAHRAELHAMQELGMKCEIEALYANDDAFDLTEYCFEKIKLIEAQSRKSLAVSASIRSESDDFF